MRSLNIFEIGLIALFVLFAMVGLFFFATFRGSSDEETRIGEVVIWGTVDGQVMRDVLNRMRSTREDFNNVSYIERDPQTLNRELLNALAAGGGPDLFLLSEDDILAHEDKIVVIPYDSYSERAFKDTFIEEGELYLTPGGILGLPFVVDPLVMYWNRDLFTREGLASPPQYWDELFDFVPRVTERDQSSNIVRSAVALGEFRNVRHAKEIFTTLLMQASDPIVVRDAEGVPRVVLGDDFGFTTVPAEAALRFYTEFSNPVKSVYSWNRSLPESRQSFLAGDLALYFGFASEFQLLRNSNPNLNFDMALLPQSRDARVSLAFGNMQAFAIPRTSDNTSGAFTAAAVLTGRDAIADASSALGLPPVRRDLLAERPADAIGSVLYSAALMSRAWLDPNPQESTDIFQRMVESTISGRARLSDAVSTANQELSQSLR